MNQIYTEDNISLNSLLDYVFKKLSIEQENAMEIFLDEHEEYADTVDGILNYCLKEEIKTKADLEKNLEVNKELFFSKFPELRASNLKQKTIGKKRKSTNKKSLWIFLPLLFAVGIFSIWQWNKVTRVELPKENIQAPNQETPKNILPNVQEIIKEKEIDNSKERDKLRATKEKKSLNRNSNITQQEPNIKANPINLNNVKDEIEVKYPLIAQADLSWNKEFTERGNPVLEDAVNQLAAGDSTQRALYCVGLNELIKNPPNLNQAIELLEKVKQYEYQDATWFLFRAYISMGNFDRAKAEFRKMKNNPNTSVYYEEKFLKNISQETKDFFQSNDN